MKITSVRFDERTWMLLKELSEKTGSSMSVIVRSMVMRNIDAWLDKAGRFKTNVNGEKEKDKKGLPGNCRDDSTAL
ncbi:MAG: hypothetical protein LBS88_07250 [Tannerellaceae bacterium]|jgi:hypothetical protein|nr:hypothetical protein [Tannerellaceae bacterium]